MDYGLLPLRYPFDAFEPHLSVEALKIHREGVHRTYAEALNDALLQVPALCGLTIEALLRSLADVPDLIRERIRFEAGGHANHQFLWKILGPGQADGPRERLGDLINRSFGSFEAFKVQFKAMALSQERQGWAFLTLPRGIESTLEIIVLPGNGSVLPLGKRGILICDLWDHAWRTDHRSRDEWIDAFWNIVDWRACEDRFEQMAPPGASSS